MHLTENTISLFFEKKLTESEKERVVNHLANCSECSGLLADLVRFSRDTSPAKKLSVDYQTISQAKKLVTGSNKIYRPKTLPAIIGLVIIFTFTLTYLSLQNSQQVTNFRSLPGRIKQINLSPYNEAIITANQLNFKWTPVNNALAYRFQLHKSDGSLMWEKLLYDTSTIIPSQIILKEGAKYLWRVEVIFPDNTKERSRLHAFTIKN